VLLHAVKEDFILVLTEAILEEARKAVEKLLPDKLVVFDQQILKAMPVIIPTPLDEEIEANLGLMRDPKDIHVALAAINSEVDILVTSDKDFTDPTQSIHQKLTVMLPGAFLRNVMGWMSEALEAIRARKWEDMPA
jgi:predicted nucleic acid-binding protein